MTRRSSCVCALDPSSLTNLSSELDVTVSACATGESTGRRRVICFPPGPGIGHQVIRSLHQILQVAGSVHLVDYPGHGNSTAVSAFSDLCGSYARFVRSSDILVGHSWGAIVAAHVAARGRPTGLVLISPPADEPRNSESSETAPLAGGFAEDVVGNRWNSEVARAVSLSRSSTHDRLGSYRRFLLGYAIPLGCGSNGDRANALMEGVADYASAWRQMRSWRTGGTEAAARQALSQGVRTLIINGTHDPLADRGLSKRLGFNVDEAEIRGNHYCYMDAPRLLSECIEVWLDREGLGS